MPRVIFSGTIEGLFIRVDRDKLHALHTADDHAVHSVSAAAADADYFYDNIIVDLIVNFERHCCLPLVVLDFPKTGL